jgi:hypothetical protein
MSGLAESAGDAHEEKNRDWVSRGLNGRGRFRRPRETRIAQGAAIVANRGTLLKVHIGIECLTEP